MITFLHKVTDGAVDKSYGIHVAALAGMPDEIIKNANVILSSYEQNKKEVNISLPNTQMKFNFESNDNLLKNELDKIDILKITPIDAMNILYRLKEISKK